MADRFPKDCWSKQCPHFHIDALNIDLICYCDLMKSRCYACDEEFCLYLCPLPDSTSGIMTNEKYDVYVRVQLNREEILLLRDLCKQIDDQKMRDNLSCRFGGALLDFGSPLFETKVRILDAEHIKPKIREILKGGAE